MENKLGLVKRMQEMKAAKEAAERKAVALAAENSRLAERLEELENENRRLREVAEEKGINVNSDKK